MYLQLDPFDHIAPEVASPRKSAQLDFFSMYQRQGIGPKMQECDIAFFPTCDGAHWFLYVADLSAKKVILLDPLREESDMPLRQRVPVHHYVMVTSEISSNLPQ